MIGSKLTDHAAANSGMNLPSSDKQQPVKTALRDLQNDNRIMVPKGKPPLAKDKGNPKGEGLVSGIKRPATECLQKSKSNQGPTSSGTNGPLVYARRKCEQELPSKSNESSKDRKTDCAQGAQQEKEKPQQQAQSESTKKSCISSLSRTSPMVTVLPKSNDFEKNKSHSQENQQEKEKPRQQAQNESTKKSSFSAISATSPMVTLPPESNEFEKEKKIDCAQKDHQEKDRPQQQAQSESTKKNSTFSAVSATSPMVTLPPISNKFEKEKNIDCAQKDQQDQGKPQQHAESESTKKSTFTAMSETSPMVTLAPKSNEFEKEKNIDRAQKDQLEQGKPQQQTESESTKKSHFSAMSETSPMVTLPPKSNEFEKEKNIDCAQKDQLEHGKLQQQTKSESTKKPHFSAMSETSPMVTLPPKSKEFEKEKKIDCAEKGQQEQGKPQQQAGSESTKKSCFPSRSATSPMVTLPPKSNESEKEKNTDFAQKDQQVQGKHPQQAQSDSTKKPCVSAISAASPVVASGGSSSLTAKPLNENSSEQKCGINMSEVSHSGKSEGLNDEQWKERYVQLQAHLRNCDQSRNQETIKRLQTLTPVGRSKYAVELEKRAIQLLLEEGNELMRMKELNVLGKAGAKNSAPPSTKQLQTEN